jgi:CRISPR-associated protein Csm4
MHIIYLVPRSGYVTDLRSDTLWGSICWGIRHLWGEDELTAFIKSYLPGNTPEFVISSTFPYRFQDGKRTPYFPNPIKTVSGTPVIQEDVEFVLTEYRLRKKLKGIEYLSLEDFKAVIQGRLTESDLMERLRKEYLHRAKYNKQADKSRDYEPLPETIRNTAPELFENSVVTHNAIDRLNGGTLSLAGEDGEEAGQLFHAEEQYWDYKYAKDIDKPQNGLFFLVEGRTDKLLPVLRLLRDWGIGADRTTGKGSFDFETEDFELEEPDKTDANAILNLSLFHPTESELGTLNGLQYQLEPREGYVGFTRARRMKQPRLFFAEGSVFAQPSDYQSKRFMGCIREQQFDEEHQPSHKVWDNGFGFMINLKWNKQ